MTKLWIFQPALAEGATPLYQDKQTLKYSLHFKPDEVRRVIRNADNDLRNDAEDGSRLVQASALSAYTYHRNATDRIA